MEIAINSLLIFLLLVFPGIIFRRFYYVGEFSKQFNSANWLNSFYISIVPGIIIQVLTLLFFLSFVFKTTYENPVVCFVNVFYLSLQNNNIPDFLFSLTFLKYLGIYFLLMILFSAILAQICWIIVRKFNLDIKFKPLRFSNYWHYYFSGEIIQTKSFKSIRDMNSGGKVILSEADVLIDLGNGENKLYKGIVAQYTICKNSGDLKNIYLTQARRFKRTPNGVNLIEIPGDILILPYEKILNINLKYVYHRGSNSLIKVISAILILLSLVVLMLNPFEILLNNVSDYGGIIGRIYLFFGWVFIIQFFQNLLLLIKFKRVNKTLIGVGTDELLKHNLKIKEAKNVLMGSFIMFFLISIIIYNFFM